MIAIVQDRQTVLDLALQHFGSAEMCVEVAERLGVGITDEPVAGSSFEYELAEVEDKKIVAAYATNNIVPATALDNE
ncbi:MAG: hypothetical protein ACRCZB_07500 [Bacteroidales bacterium]